MIYDSIYNASKYYMLGSRIETALKLLESKVIKNYPVGNRIISGDGYWLNVMEYSPRELDAADPETHKKHFDISLILEGKEMVGYGDSEKYGDAYISDEEQDFFFFKGSMNYMVAERDHFMIVFPNEAHAPSIEIAGCKYVRKALIKVETE